MRAYRDFIRFKNDNPGFEAEYHEITKLVNSLSPTSGEHGEFTFTSTKNPELLKSLSTGTIDALSHELVKHIGSETAAAIIAENEENAANTANAIGVALAFIEALEKINQMADDKKLLDGRDKQKLEKRKLLYAAEIYVRGNTQTPIDGPSVTRPTLEQVNLYKKFEGLENRYEFYKREEEKYTNPNINNPQSIRASQ